MTRGRTTPKPPPAPPPLNVEAAVQELLARVGNAETRVGLIEAEGKQRSRRLNDKRLLQLLEATASTLALAIEELKAGIGPSALTWAALALAGGLILPLLLRPVGGA